MDNITFFASSVVGLITGVYFVRLGNIKPESSEKQLARKGAGYFLVAVSSFGVLSAIFFSLAS
ncbi:MAG: hypothetical protein TUN42_08645 [Dehalogenimonas sp.]